MVASTNMHAFWITFNGEKLENEVSMTTGGMEIHTDEKPDATPGPVINGVIFLPWDDDGSTSPEDCCAFHRRGKITL